MAYVTCRIKNSTPRHVFLPRMTDKATPRKTKFAGMAGLDIALVGHDKKLVTSTDETCFLRCDLCQRLFFGGESVFWSEYSDYLICDDPCSDQIDASDPLSWELHCAIVVCEEPMEEEMEEFEKEQLCGMVDPDAWECAKNVEHLGIVAMKKAASDWYILQANNDYHESSQWANETE